MSCKKERMPTIPSGYETFKNMTLWKHYIHLIMIMMYSDVYDVCVTKFQILDLLILTRNKDLLDVL